jgi:hypothetical protein
MRTQYASTPAPSAPVLVTSSGNTTIAVAGTKYIWIYCRNRSGVTDFSPVTSIVIAPDQSLLIPLASTIRKTASDIHEIGVVMANTNSPSSGCVVATYPGFDIDGVTPATLPTTITLSRDSHFQLNAVVANPAALPSSNRINGMRRYVTSTANFVEWSDRASAWILCNPQNFNPYVASTIDEGGANVDLSKITNYSAIITPDYDVSGDLSAPVKFWIVNDTNYVTPQGKRVRIACSTANNEVVSDDFKGLMKITFLGYANTLTGVLDTTGMSVGGQMDYQGDVITNLLLPKDLPAGSAYVLQVQMAFDMADVDNKAYQGEVVKIYPYLAPHYAEYDPAYDDIGDRIFPTGGKRRILPNGAGLDLLADSGSGSIAYYKWRNIGQTDVFGASLDTADQKVLITNNGTCFVANTVPDTAGLRAVISTVDSVGHPTAWTGSIALDGTKILSITVTHATAIRADYPDIIAGTTATLNAGKVRVYARIIGSSNIRVFDAPIIGVNPTETILVGASGSTMITSLPSIDAEVGLFTPTSFTRTFETNPSVFTSGNYEIAIAYLYEDTVTSISHDVALGCVIESGGTLTELQSLFRVIGQPVANLDALRLLELAKIFPWQTRYIIFENVEYRFNPTSYGADDSNSIIRPSATNISSPGRWIKIAGGSGGGLDYNILDKILTDSTGNVLVSANGNVLYTL